MTSVGAGLIGLLLLLAVVALVIEILFLLNLQRTLERISPANQAMLPALVWLGLIPLFGWGWFIYTVVKIRDSARAEFRSRGWLPEGDFGYSIGIAAGVLAPICYVFSWLPNSLKYAEAVLGLGYLICWIMYWVRIARLKNRLGPPAAQQWPGRYPTYFENRGSTGWPPAGQRPGGQPPSAPPAGATDADRQVRRCPACGSAVAPEDKFCRTCGSQLS